MLIVGYREGKRGGVFCQHLQAEAEASSLDLGWQMKVH